jgi:hypothetical protein
LKSEALFSISVIDGALNLVQHLNMYSNSTLEEASVLLRRGPASSANCDYRRASSAIKRYGLETFTPLPNRQATIRSIVQRLTMLARPMWAVAAPFGRERCKAVMPDDAQQLLSYAGLFEMPPSQEVVEWWDQLAASFRTRNDEGMNAAGREGERLTLEHERRKLAQIGIADHEPVWVAIEDNTLGYDVLSWQRDKTGAIAEMPIEVKAHSPLHPRVLVTRNEWKAALRFRDRYTFHVWDLKHLSLAEYRPEAIQPHIPEDWGSGSWQVVSIPVPVVPVSVQ